jgi:hypothetical protein
MALQASWLDAPAGDARFRSDVSCDCIYYTRRGEIEIGYTDLRVCAAGRDGVVATGAAAGRAGAAGAGARG